jgi:tRNA(Arg) A34 adenosine deaminase TadA
MERAIELSKYAGLVVKSGGVFGAVVVKNGKIVGEGYNQVVARKDPTWHGEMHAIRDGCYNLDTFDLSGCVMYTSCEPCPMCLSASFWAKLEKIFYGATHHDALVYGNFADSNILTELCKDPLSRSIPCEQHMQHEVVQVWKEYASLPDKTHY